MTELLERTVSPVGAFVKDDSPLLTEGGVELNKEVKAITCILLFLSYSYSNLETYGIQFLTYALKLIPKQIIGRYLMFQIFITAGELKLAKDTYEEIENLSMNRISDLPADYYLNTNQLNILKGELNGI